MKKLFTNYLKKPFKRKAAVLMLTALFVITGLNAQDLHARLNQMQEVQQISLRVDNKTTYDILKEIEKKSSYVFIYTNNKINGKFKQSVDVENESIESILNKVLKPIGVDYKIVGKQIILSIALKNKEDKRTYLDKTITGRVLSQEDNQPLPGVNILVKGTTTGTVTDVNGRYSIVVPDENTTLVFSSVGYQSEEVLVGARSTLDVNLVPDISQLNEIVVVGYGTQEKRAVTGSVAQLKPIQISQNINADAVTALQGHVPGVQITQQGGRPGGGIRIRVRGNASMLSSGDPLLVVDGIPVISSSFGSEGAALSGISEINPNDIESMEVLKDAAAAAIYGSRAANGVILITTKKGKAGQSNININYQHGVSTPTNTIEMLNGPDYLAVHQRAFQNSVYSGTGNRNYRPLPRNVVNENGYDYSVAENTDVNWMDYALRTASFKDANVSASTGTQNTSVYGSVAFRDEDGIEVGTDFSRASARLNAQNRAIKGLTIGANIALSYLERNNTANHFQTAQKQALPIFPIYRPDDASLYFNGWNYDDKSVGSNILFRLDNSSNLVKTYRSISNISAEYEFIPGLSLRTEWGYDYQNNVGDIYESKDLFPVLANNNSAKGQGGGKTETRRFYSAAWNTNNILTYNKTINNTHNFTVLVGSSILNQRNSGRTFVAEGIPFDYVKTQATSVVVISQSESVFRFASGFSRVNYNFKNKYFIEGSYRVDGSSRFGPENRIGNFGGGSIGWAISEEDFFKNNVSFSNYLKLRASYGTVGNAELPSDFLYLSTGNIDDSEIGYAIYRGIAFQRLGNPNLKWETTTQMNFGLDYGFFNNRISGSIEYFDKKSEDLLLTTQLANSTGFLDRNYTVNIGSLRNKGAEFSINTVNIEKGGFSWTSNFNISRITAKVIQLTPRVNAEDNKIKYLESGSTKLVEGGVFGAYFLPVHAGTDPVTGNELIYEVDQEYLETTGISRLTGNVLDAEKLGGNINNHRMILTDKTPHPDFYGGFSNNLAYKGFDLNFLIYFQVGNYILDEGEREQSYPSEQQSLRASLKNRLDDPLGSFTNGPLIYDSRIAGNNTTRFLHDGSFARLRNVQLGYSLPKTLTDRIGTKVIRVYVSGQNLLTFTKFKGWDPEVFTASNDQTRANLGPGVTRYNLPQVKTVLIGVNLNF